MDQEKVKKRELEAKVKELRETLDKTKCEAKQVEVLSRAQVTDLESKLQEANYIKNRLKEELENSPEFSTLKLAVDRLLRKVFLGENTHLSEAETVMFKEMFGRKQNEDYLQICQM